MLEFNRSIEKISTHAGAILALDGVLLGILAIKPSEEQNPLSPGLWGIYTISLLLLIFSLFCSIGAINTGIQTQGSPENFRQLAEREKKIIFWYSFALLFLLLGSLALGGFEAISAVPQNLSLFLPLILFTVILGAELVIWWSRRLILVRIPVKIGKPKILTKILKVCYTIIQFRILDRF